MLAVYERKGCLNSVETSKLAEKPVVKSHQAMML
jgi:hypothetical protein